MAIKDIAIVARNNLVVDQVRASEMEITKMTLDMSGIQHDIMILADLEAIRQWETWFELPHNEDWTLYDRKVRLVYTFNSRGFFTKTFLQGLAHNFSNSDIDIEEDYENYHFVVNFVSYVGKPENMESFEYMVEINKPAHLTWEYVFRYRTHEELAKYKHQFLEDYTHEELYSRRDLDEPEHPLHPAYSLSADNNELFIEGNNPYLFPFNTMDNAGIDVYEETLTYKIYMDKNRRMTTVNEYVPGAYQKFTEIQNLINDNEAILKSYKIEWNELDDSELFKVINSDLLLKAKIPYMLDGRLITPKFSSKSVPTTYKCCFRVDKFTNQFYIGAGYENLLDPTTAWNESFNTSSYIPACADGSNYSWDFEQKETAYTHLYVRRPFLCVDGATYYASVSNIHADYTDISEDGLDFQVFDDSWNILLATPTENAFTAVGDVCHFSSSSTTSSEKITVSMVMGEPQITKTTEKKPFVKSIMPSGKLQLKNSADDTQFSFIYKGAITTIEGGIKHQILQGDAKGYGRHLYELNATLKCIKTDLAWAESFTGDLITDTEIPVQSGMAQPVLINFTYRYDASAEYFNRILIYNRKLSKAQLIEENNKY